MISIEATKKGHLSVDYEKRKHWLVTKIRNVSGNDEAIVSLCSRVSKSLGAQARVVRKQKGEKVIEIQGKHEETRVSRFRSFFSLFLFSLWFYFLRLSSQTDDFYVLLRE